MPMRGPEREERERWRDCSGSSSGSSSMGRCGYCFWRRGWLRGALQLVLACALGWLVANAVLSSPGGTAANARDDGDQEWTSSSSAAATATECTRAVPPELRLEPNRKRVLLGIMTAAKYVDSRAWEVWRTWAKDFPGKVVFFVAERTQSAHPELPLVRLPGVDDDAYPPQKKSFAMLRWMHDNMLDHFDWFMRADDDLYVKGDTLVSFLSGLDSSRPLLVGQAGLGNQAEYGQLALGTHDNYCMGGPGVLLSRELLRRLAPRLESCLSHLVTGHEDVELGRCIRRHVGVACTWNYEMQTLFHNNQSTSAAYQSRHGAIDELGPAITLHPVKQPAVMRRIHAAALTNKLRATRHALARLMPELSRSRLDAPALLRAAPNTTADMLPFHFVSANKIIFCTDGTACPRHTLELSHRSAIADIVNQLFTELNSNARQRGRILQFQSVHYGYIRVDPQFAAHYVLDIVLWFKKFRPPQRTTLSLRRHAYLEQTFGAPRSIADADWRRLEAQRRRAALAAATAAATAAAAAVATDDNFEKGLAPPIEIDQSPPRVHIILPLSGRADIFKRFANHLEGVCGEEGRRSMSLVVVLFGDDRLDEATRTNVETAERLSRAGLPVRLVRMMDAPFSRGVALMRGAMGLPDSALLFFSDVDMLFTCDALHRAMANAIQGVQVWFPVVFSEHAPEWWSEGERLFADAFHHGRRRGYFRHFGYGLAALYHQDLKTIGGFDEAIAGWGMEDVDLFEKAVKSGLRVMRAPEPELVHVYHPIECPDSLAVAQRRMCTGSRAASLASLDALFEHVQHLAAR